MCTAMTAAVAHAQRGGLLSRLYACQEPEGDQDPAVKLRLASNTPADDQEGSC